MCIFKSTSLFEQDIFLYQLDLRLIKCPVSWGDVKVTQKQPRSCRSYILVLIKLLFGPDTDQSPPIEYLQCVLQYPWDIKSSHFYTQSPVSTYIYVQSSRFTACQLFFFGSTFVPINHLKCVLHYDLRLRHIIKF